MKLSILNKFLYLCLSLLIVIVTAPNAYAKSKKSSASKATNVNQLGAKLGTDHSFDQLSVRGRYQSAFEGVATVENEKVIEDLLDYRTQYADRLKHSRSQR